MAYADFGYYTNNYKGKAIASQEDFDYYAELAKDYIDIYTNGRATEFNEQVKRCNCRIADILRYNNGSLSEKEKASESIGGYSVSYANASSGKDEVQVGNQIRGAIILYLAPTGLLNRSL